MIFAFSPLATSHAVPVKPKTPTKTVKARPKISVDTKARAIFGRAAKLYGTTKGLSAGWKGRDEYGEAASGTLDFDRAGRLCLAQTNTVEPLIVMDGKTRWSLSIPDDVDEKGHRFYSCIEADPDKIYIEIQLANDPTDKLGDLLSGGSPLDAEKIAMNVEIMQLQEFRATLLAPQKTDGQICDLVRISETSATKHKGDPTYIEQKTYWFARSDGRLVRLQDKISIGVKEKSSADWQFFRQTFNPKFAPAIFKFVSPKGAKLEDQ